MWAWQSWPAVTPAYIALPQQLPGTQPLDDGEDPQHPVSPAPGSLPSDLAPDRLEGAERSLVSSELPHFSQQDSSLLAYTIFSSTLPQDVHKNSNMGIAIFLLVKIYQTSRTKPTEPKANLSPNSKASLAIGACPVQWLTASNSMLNSFSASMLGFNCDWGERPR